MAEENQHPIPVQKHFTANIPLPGKLEMQGDVELNWKRFQRQWRNYSIAARLDKEAESFQVAVLLSCVGVEAQDVFEGLPFAGEDDKGKIDVVLHKFEEFCMGSTNEVYESFKFHSRQQQDGENIEAYVATLRSMAKSCKFQEENRMIRDRLVMGIRDDRVREKLLEEKGLDLVKAVQICKAHEASKLQVKLMGAATEASVNALKNKMKRSTHQTQPLHRHHEGTKLERGPKSRSVQHLHQKCTRCGREPHSKEWCPATSAKCRKCSRVGHYAVCCRSSAVHAVEEEDSDSDKSYMGMIVCEVYSNPWKAVIQVNGEQSLFKLDTGADVTVMPDRLINKTVKLQKSEKKLFGPS